MREREIMRVLGKQINEIFQPRLKVGSIPWDKSDMVGYGIDVLTPLDDVKNVWLACKDFFIRKQFEYSLFIMIDNSFMPLQAVASTAQERDYVETTLHNIDVDPNCRGVVDIHNHRASDSPSIEVFIGGEVAFRIPEPSEEDIIAMRKIATEGKLPLFGYIIQGPYCLKYFPIDEVDIYDTRQYRNYPYYVEASPDSDPDIVTADPDLGLIVKERDVFTRDGVHYIAKKIILDKYKEILGKY